MPLPLPTSTVDRLNDGDEVVYLIPLLDASEIGDEACEAAIAQGMLSTLRDGICPETGRAVFNVTEPCLCLSTFDEVALDLHDKVTGAKTQATLSVGSAQTWEASVKLAVAPGTFEPGYTYPSNITPPHLFRARLILVGVERRSPSSFTAQEIEQIWGGTTDSFEEGLRKRYPEVAPALEPCYYLARFRLQRVTAPG